MNAVRMGGFMPGPDAHPIPGAGYVGENEAWPECRPADPIREFAIALTHETRNRSVESIFEEEDRAVRTEQVLRDLVADGKLDITYRPALRGV